MNTKHQEPKGPKVFFFCDPTTFMNTRHQKFEESKGPKVYEPKTPQIYEDKTP